MRLTRFTPLFLAAPRRYIERSRKWRLRDLEDFNERFEWEEDPVDGYADYVSAAETVWTFETGDCEDYALVVCNILASRQHRPVRLVILGNRWNPVAKHVAVYDGDNIYSSGQILEDTTVEEYTENSRYDWSVERTVLNDG